MDGKLCLNCIASLAIAWWGFFLVSVMFFSEKWKETKQQPFSRKTGSLRMWLFMKAEHFPEECVSHESGYCYVWNPFFPTQEIHTQNHSGVWQLRASCTYHSKHKAFRSKEEMLKHLTLHTFSSSAQRHLTPGTTTIHQRQRTITLTLPHDRQQQSSIPFCKREWDEILKPMQKRQGDEGERSKLWGKGCQKSATASRAKLKLGCALCMYVCVCIVVGLPPHCVRHNSNIQSNLFLGVVYS